MALESCQFRTFSGTFGAELVSDRGSELALDRPPAGERTGQKELRSVVPAGNLARAEGIRL